MLKTIAQLISFLLISWILSSCAQHVWSFSSLTNSSSLTDANHTLPIKKLPAHIALLLPLQGPTGQAGNIIRDGFLSAYYQETTSNPKPALSFYDTASGQPITQLYQKAIAEGADFIIGPLTKPEVITLSNYQSLTVPVLALNYTDNNLPPNFFEFGLAPEIEAIELAQHAHDAGYNRALLIAPENSWGHRVADSLINEWQKVGGKLSDKLFFTQREKLTSDIANLLQVKKSSADDDIPLEEKRRQDFDVIFLLATPADAREIMPLLKYNYILNIPVLATSTIYSGKPDPAADIDLNGIHFSETPWILQLANKHATHNNSRYFSRLYAVGRDAWLLATQIDQLRANPQISTTGATGELNLLIDQRIYRHPVWAEFRNGYATPEAR